MNDDNKKIAVLDFGGQYAHLIASRMRRLGAYTEITSPETMTAEKARREFSGIIYSGGPSSVYEEGAPRADAELLQCGLPVLGICYGHQLMMQQAGGRVLSSNNREYGPAQLRIKEQRGIFAGESASEGSQVWMSHGDEVAELPPGFIVMGSTEDCEFAAVGDPERNLFGLQFHPEVTDTLRGESYLNSFIRLCNLEGSWDLREFMEREEKLIREQVGDKKVFFLISGGVDSTVAYALLARALPTEHLRGLLVDTGFMREREVEVVREALLKLGVQLEVEDASDDYYRALDGIAEPEKKRVTIGELFVDVQGSVSERLGLNAEEWYLGQGTIYPDRIESGATKNSHKIKTHHNRVDRIEELLRAGRVVEPIADLYKDEVRNLGRLLGLPDEIVERHPFPGPGLAVRCLCVDQVLTVPEELRSAIEGTGEISAACSEKGYAPLVLPVQSVGVQGDKRSYASPVVLVNRDADRGGVANMGDWDVVAELARMIPNRVSGVNRVLLFAGGRAHPLPAHPLKEQGAYRTMAPAHLTRERMAILRRADHIVGEFLHEKNLYGEIWQFPVVIAPVAFAQGDVRRESIILRPVNSTEAMTASAYRMAPDLLNELTKRLLEVPEIDGVFYDLTSKPPGTIEWE